MTKLATILLATTAIARLAYFDPGKSEWKKDPATGALALDANGNPIWLSAEGAEQIIQGETITRLNGEARNNRLRAETAEAKVKEFEGLDPAKAREALDTVGKLKQGDLISAGKVDEVRAELTKGFEGKINEATEKATKSEQRLNSVLLGSAFVGSKFIGEKLIIPPDIAQATFANRFKIEGDKVIGVKPDGSPIYSIKNMGEVADFDEALSIVVEGYANKNAILKGANNQGSGNGGGGGNGPGGKRTLARSQFDALAPAEKAAFAKDMSAGKAEIT